MSFASRAVPNSSTASVTVTNVTEKVVATTNTVSTVSIGQLIIVDFFIQVTIGTTQTGLVAKIYRGAAATGTPIFTSGTITVTGAQVRTEDFHWTDQFTGDVAAQQWCLSLTQSGGAGDATVTNAYTNVVLV